MLFRRIMVAVGAAASVAAAGTATLSTSAFAAETHTAATKAGAAAGAAGTHTTTIATETGTAAGAAGTRSTTPAADTRTAATVSDVLLTRGEPSTQDTAFLQAANEINLAGIAHGRIAWNKTKNAEVKKIAGKFMVDHIRLNAEITEAARALKIRLNNGPNAEQLALAERYEAASAGSFDALYLSTQLELQREAERIADAQVADGSDANLKQVAAAAAPILADHQKLLTAATS